MKIKLLITSLLIIWGTLQMNAQENSNSQIWENDPSHSRLGFEVKHLNISYIDGYFSDFKVKIVTHNADLLDMQIEVTAQTASIDTGVEARDNHLRSADFFNVQEFPTLTFKSTEIIKEGNANAKLIGDLTILGVTKTVTLEVTYFGTIPNPMASGQEIAGFQVKGEINRTDFDLGKTFPGTVISDKVKIIANLEFTPVSE